MDRIPPLFCAATETARDIIQELLQTQLPPHQFELQMLPASYKPDTMQSVADLSHTLDLIEVFVDDFIGFTNTATKEHLLHFSRAMLHGIHEIFPPPLVSGHSGGDPISEKKLKNLEGLWDNVKEVLRWILNGVNFTIALPPEKMKNIQARLKQILCWKKICLNYMQKIAGTLLHATFGIPGRRGLFNPLWASMKAQTP